LCLSCRADCVSLQTFSKRPMELINCATQQIRCFQCESAGGGSQPALAIVACSRGPYLLLNKLESSCARLPQSANHTGDDQVGALCVCASVCVVRGNAGGKGMAGWPAARLDCGRHGSGALSSHGIQSLG